MMFAKISNTQPDNLSHLQYFISGGIGGLCCWLASYP